MTASTDQERAEFEVWARDRYPSIDLTRDGDDYSKALAKDYWSLWQAARRAPVVPVPQGWKLVPEKGTEAMARAFRADDAPGYFCMTTLRCADFAERYAAMLAAAPQPPEAAQLDDIGVVDMAQAVDLKEAAHVQLPEPVYTMRVRGMLHDYTPGLQAFDLDDGEHKLYTEHQVLAILAQHGIKTT